MTANAQSLTGDLSKGMQQKIQFAAAVIHDPEMVVLDEPFTGLDPVNTRLLKELILEQRDRGATVVLSTHRMEQVEALCESICLIHRGRPVLTGNLAEIKAGYGRNTIAVEYHGAQGALGNLTGVRRCEDTGHARGRYYARETGNQTVLRALERAVEATVLDRLLVDTGVDVDQVRSLQRADLGTVTVSADGESEGGFRAAFLSTLVLAMLLYMAVLINGQGMAIVEEKASRLIEVILGAVTATEFMAGKIVGVLGSGLTQLAVWVAAALVGLLYALPMLSMSVDLAGIDLAAILNKRLIFYFSVFFTLGYCLYSIVFATIAATCTSTEELGQSMFAAVLPMVLALMSTIYVIAWSAIVALARRYPHVRGINLQRNFGQHNALLAGIRASKGDIVITMDDDLQHPPDAVPRLIQALEGGDLVYGTPTGRVQGRGRSLAATISKLGFATVLGATRARHISAFRAFRGSLRRVFLEYDSPHVSIDVLLQWVTTRVVSVPVDFQPRRRGRSGYGFWSLLTLTVDMVTGFSVWPLRLASVVGLAFAGFGGLVLLYVLVRFLTAGARVPGFAFLASVIAIFAGAQLFSLGIIGEYLARMYYRNLDRPPYLVESSVNLAGLEHLT